MCTATAALVAGSVIQGTAGFIGARAEADSLEFKSKVAENDARFLDIQADQEAQKGAQTDVQLRQQTSQQVAANVAQTAGSGVDIGGATAREVFESTERVGIADVILNQINTKRNVWRLKTGAQAKRTEAKRLKKAGKFTKRFAPLALAAPIAKGGAQARLAQKQGAK
jgi:hypothetical protein